MATVTVKNLMITKNILEWKETKRMDALESFLFRYKIVSYFCKMSKANGELKERVFSVYESVSKINCLKIFSQISLKIF